MMKKIFLGFIYHIIMRTFLKIIVGVKYRNKEVLKKTPQFILVSNHNSHLDSMAMLSSLPLSQLVKTHPVAAADYFGKSKFRSFLSRNLVNAILIKRTREKEDKSPIEIMTDVLKMGDSIILYPEGTRGEPEKMQEFKKGIGVLLQRNPNVPFIPVFMKGMGKVLPRGEKLLVPFDTYVCFGEPVFCESKDVDEILKEVENAIRKVAEASSLKYTSPSAIIQ